MGTRTDEWRVTRAELGSRAAPRDDVIVRETAVRDVASGSGEPIGHVPGTDPWGQDLPTSGERTFTDADGPFAHYERRLVWRTEPGEAGETEPAATVVLTQQITWRLSFPYWRWLYRPMVGRSLRDGIPSGAHPWWLFPDRLSPSQARTVSTMAMLSLVSGLLYGQLTQVLTFAGADIGNGSSGQQAAVFALVRVGALLTAFAMVQADRFGRRRVAIWCLGLAAVTSFATALVPGLAALTVLQAVSRNLAIAGLLAVDTICVEELPAGSRAMAAGLGAMAYGLGAGVVVVSLPLADLAPWGWRLVFGLSLVAAPLIVSGTRHLHESGRFRDLALPGPDPGTGGHANDRKGEIVSTHRPRARIRGSRFVLLASMFLLINLIVAPMSQLQNDYLRTDRGFTGLTITVFTVLTGTPAAIGVILGGRLADTRGRRIALIPGLIALGVLTAAFFALSGAPMWIASLLVGVFGALTVAPLGVLAPELFPTARRGGARGALNVLAVSGSVTGLVLAGMGVDAWGYGPTFALLAIGPLIAAGLAFAVPETRGRELEDINEES